MRTAAYALAATLITLAVPATSHAYTLGAADGTSEAAPIAAQMGARTYRVVIDPSKGLDAYAHRIDAYRDLGMRPQLAIGGTGTDVRGKTEAQGHWIINTALKAFQRWPDTYSISVVNEPDIAGITACQYAKTFRRAYRALKKAGVPRVLFGEWSPNNPRGWTEATYKRCGKHPVTADGFAWHCYDDLDVWVGIGEARNLHRWLSSKWMRRWLHTPRKFTLPMFCTEYGVITRGVHSAGQTEAQGAARWGRALRIAKQQKLAQIVAWGISEAHADSVWDSSLVRSDGSFRPAFHQIKGR